MKIKAFLQITFTTLALALFACSSGQSSANENAEATTADSANAHKEVVKAKVTELSVEKLEILREAGTDVVLLDVRTPGEVADGKIPGAIEIDYQGKNFEKQIDALGREKSYIVYCAAGGRSSKAANMMSQMGFRNVFNLTGGYDEWKKYTEQ
jgi:rhodanese-related sulfurtransferase